MIDVIEDIDEDVLDGYQGKWAALCFMKDGSTCLGKNRFNKKSEVEEAIKEFWEMHSRAKANGYSGVRDDKYTPSLITSKVAYVIPIPIGEVP